MIKVIRKLRKKASKTTTAKSTPAKATSKPTVKKTVKKTVKNKPKKISQQEYFAMVEKKAYEFYVNRGYSQGNDTDDWYEAEKLVKISLGK